MIKCSRCGQPHDRSQRYCQSCHNAYMREWRKGREPTPWQRFSRPPPPLKRQACEHCGAPDTERHHPDYRDSLTVIWLCKPCHRRLHEGERPKGHHYGV